MNSEFLAVKNAVLEVISSGITEITPLTNEKKSGIYMIYIDSFDDEKIIPIYIGQSKDVQARYKSHYKEILSLNRLSYDEYREYIEKDFYEGHYRCCKIFKYMIDHGCCLKDYHLILLEYCEEAELDSREQYYIEKFKSEYFGFNQLNTISLRFAYYRNRQDKSVALSYFNVVRKNIELIKKFWGYGFTVFNYEYGFPKEKLTLSNKNDTELCEVVNCVNQGISELLEFVSSKYISKLDLIRKRKEEINNKIEENNSLIVPYEGKIKKKKRCIREKFKELFQYSPTRKEFECFIQGIEDKKARKQFNSMMKAKNMKFLAYVRLKEDLGILQAMFVEYNNVLADIKEKNDYEQNLRRKLQEEKKCLTGNFLIKHLFPAKLFLPFSLQDCHRFEEVGERSLTFIISNNGRSAIPELVMVLAQFCNEKKGYYIDTLTTQFAQKGIYYIEKDAYFPRSFYGREPFNILPSLENRILDNYISVLTEYKTGINDFSFRDVELVNLKDVVNELLPVLKSEKKIKIKATESRTVLHFVLENSLDKRTYRKILEFL